MRGLAIRICKNVRRSRYCHFFQYRSGIYNDGITFFDTSRVIWVFEFSMSFRPTYYKCKNLRMQLKSPYYQYGLGWVLTQIITRVHKDSLTLTYLLSNINIWLVNIILIPTCRFFGNININQSFVSFIKILDL